MPIEIDDPMAFGARYTFQLPFDEEPEWEIRGQDEFYNRVEFRGDPRPSAREYVRGRDYAERFGRNWLADCQCPPCRGAVDECEPGSLGWASELTVEQLLN